jgi:hypothetical protein
MEEAMLKQTLICTALVASIFAGSHIATGAESDPEDESKAFANRSPRAEYGTPAEAKAMLQRAVAAIRAGKGEAIASFNHNNSQFRDRDLFVFCFNVQDGKLTAHEAFVTHDVRKLRDGQGKGYGLEMYNDAQEGRIVEVSFSSPVPGWTELANKSAYLTRVDDQVCGVSAYRADYHG